MPDVLIAGGGVIGLSTAWELAEQGVSVALIEQSRLGQEASWAGAGMLPPGNLDCASPGEPALRALSYTAWPDWSGRLHASTGIDTGFRNSGSLRLVSEEDASAEFNDWKNECVTAELLTHREMLQWEPEIRAEQMLAVRLPQQCQVRNPRLLKALVAACREAGVEFHEGTPVVGWDFEQERIVAARTATGAVSAGQFVITAGAWSKTLLEAADCLLSVEPVRGQIALLRSRSGLFRHIVERGTRYLVPRDDGRVIAGSTEEWVGYLKANTARGIQGLLEFAAECVPALADAELERCWSGLRPHLKNALPIIGKVPQTENLYVAAGHFRSGLQNSPGTAILLREELLGQPNSIDLQPFSPAERVAENVASRT